MKQIRVSTFFILVVISLVLLALLGYFHTSIEHSLSLGGYIIPLISLLLSFYIIFLYWNNNRENDIIKSEFITIVTHKFRTPLTEVKWIAESLKKDISFVEKEDLVNQLMRANERLEEIVDILVNFVKFGEQLDYAYKAVSLRDLMDETLKKYAQSIREKRINFSINFEKDIPLIIIDEAKIQFVIDILFDNALKYTSVGGSVHISITQSEKFINFMVEDSGIGVNPKDIKHVSGRFFRTDGAKKVDTEGLGLGLYTAKKVIEGHGGKLNIVSKGENKGSIFGFSIPKH